MSANKEENQQDLGGRDTEQASQQVADVSFDLLAENGDWTGNIKISDSVIATIVRKYALEVPGVVRFASGSLVSGLTEMLSKKVPESSPVRVELEGDAVIIVVRLVLEFGVQIRDVATMVQDVIKDRVEKLSGNHVARVDVIVQDLEELPEAAESQQDLPAES